MIKNNWLDKLNETQIINKNKEFWKYLSEKAYPVTKGKFRIPISLEPFIMEEKEYLELKNNLINLISAAKKIVNAYFKDSELKKIIVLDYKEEDLIKNSKKDDLIGVIRIDTFNKNGIKIVEINADFPDGLFMHDITAKKIANLEGKKLISRPHSKIFSELLSSIIEKDKNIFIGYDKERIFIDEFILTKEELIKNGWKNVNTNSFDKIDLIDNSLYYKDKKIDLIRRGTELSKLRELKELIKTIEKSNVKIINNFKMRLLGHKSLLIALSDEKFHKYLSKDEISSIKKILPKTTKINKSNIKEIIDNKERWVLKPSDLTEGQGILIGIETENKKWKSEIKKILNNPDKWVIQEKIEIPETEFKIIKDNSVKTEKKKYDLNPHLFLFKDKIIMGKIIVRFSDASILNVMKGGGLAYAFLQK